MCLSLMRPLLGTWLTTQACSLTGNRTGNPLICRMTPNPLSHTSQGLLLISNSQIKPCRRYTRTGKIVAHTGFTVPSTTGVLECVPMDLGANCGTDRWNSLPGPRVRWKTVQTDRRANGGHICVWPGVASPEGSERNKVLLKSACAEACGWRQACGSRTRGAHSRVRAQGARTYHVQQPRAQPCSCNMARNAATGATRGCCLVEPGQPPWSWEAGAMLSSAPPCGCLGPALAAGEREPAGDLPPAGTG